MKIRKSSTFATAAILMFGGMALVGCNKDEAATTNPPGTPPANPTTGQKVGNAVDGAINSVSGATTQLAGALSATGANKLDGAHEAIEGVTVKALTTNDFKDVASYFTSAEQDRVVKSKPDTKDLDDQIDAFNTAWKTKYNYAFKIKDLNVEYPDAFVHFGQDSADGAKATGIIAAAHGAPEITIPFVQEGGLWKINIPNSVDGQVLHDNLLAAIRSLNQAAPTWPDSDVEAAQAVTHSILGAVMNTK
jgi:hypothetical protein